MSMSTQPQKHLDIFQTGERITYEVIPLSPKQQIAWEQTKTNFLLRCPAFAHILYTLMSKSAGDSRAIFTKEVPIAATDGSNLLLNPETFFGYTLNERVFIIAHEVCHGIFNHMGLIHGFKKRQKVRYADGTELDFDMGQMNIAMDLVINDLLVENKIGTYNKQWYHDPSKVKGTDSVIDAYRKIYDPTQTGNGSSGPCNGGQGGFDQHLAPGQVQGKDAQQAVAEREADAQEWKAQLAQGIASAKAKGLLPAGLERMFSQELEPKITWSEHIQGFFARKVGSGNSDWRRPDRRHIVRDEQLYLPSRTGYGAERVVVGVDTSGSVNRETLDMFMAEMSGILEDVRPKELIVMFCDAKVHSVDYCEEPSDLTHLRAKGGGGTDMGKIFEKVEAMGLEKDVDAVVILTDGLTPFPSKVPDYPVLWGSIYCTPDKYPFGEVVMIPKQSSTKKAA